MISLVGSLADNKAALGRRYAEWAISAPTLESAVAAAAMAQDELGHARSTYPVLKALGVETTDESHVGSGNRARAARRPAPGLDRLHRGQPARRRRADDLRGRVRGQLGDAARPAREEDPPGGGLASRARRGVGEATVPGRRPRARRPSSSASLQTWEHGGALDRAGRRQRATAPPSSAGMVRVDPARQRERVRVWLVELLGRRGASRSRSTSRRTGRHGTRPARRWSP